MFETNEEGKVRLYFTEDKICIGSYNEVTKYEQETKKSYWATDFFKLPPDYNPIGKTAHEIELAEATITFIKVSENNLGI